jgi:hypothetical protein
MTSTRKSESARANGAKSRGPKTAEGRATSSRNALTHGFTSRSTIILECENHGEFQQILAEYRATYHPETPAEHALVEQMVAARWRIRRLWTIETALIDNEIARRQAQVNHEFTNPDPGIELALAFQSLTDDSRAISLISRYEARLSRMHDRAYATLRELQADRQNKKSPNEPTAVEKTNDVNPVTADQAAEPAAAASTQAQNGDSLERRERSVDAGHNDLRPAALLPQPKHPC